MGRPQLTAEQIAEQAAERAWSRFVAQWREKWLPWCDTCEQPAVFHEQHGWRHVTPAHRAGLPADLDTSGHAATAIQWWRGQDHPDDTDAVLVATTEDDPR